MVVRLSQVQLAVQTYELVDKHIRHLDGDLARYQSECHESEKQQQEASRAQPAPPPPTTNSSSSGSAGMSRKASSGSIAAIKKKKRRAVDSSEDDVNKAQLSRHQSAAATKGQQQSKKKGSRGDGAAGGSGRASTRAKTPEPVPGASPVLAELAKEAGEVFDMPVDPNEPTYCLLVSSRQRSDQFFLLVFLNYGLLIHRQLIWMCNKKLTDARRPGT